MQSYLGDYFSLELLCNKYTTVYIKSGKLVTICMIIWYQINLQMNASRHEWFILLSSQW